MPPSPKGSSGYVSFRCWPPRAQPSQHHQRVREERLIVADAEVLDLAVAEVAARHDVELACDTARDVLRVQLRLARVDLLEPAF